MGAGKKVRIVHTEVSMYEGKYVGVIAEVKYWKTWRKILPFLTLSGQMHYGSVRCPKCLLSSKCLFMKCKKKNEQ